jgi:DNA polymerase (family 10)
MDNYAIADNFSLLSKLMEIHGENSFKTKTYSIAAFNIEKLPCSLAKLPMKKYSPLKELATALERRCSKCSLQGK